MRKKWNKRKPREKKNRTLGVNHQVGFRRSWISEPSEREEGEKRGQVEGDKGRRKV